MIEPPIDPNPSFDWMELVIAVCVLALVLIFAGTIPPGPFHEPKDES